MQVFNDKACTEYFDGKSNVCYVRLNEGITEGFNKVWGDGSNPSVTAFVNSDDGYNVVMYVDFGGPSSPDPIEPGTVVACIAPPDTYDFEPQVVFYNN